MALQTGIVLLATALFVGTAWLARRSASEPERRSAFLTAWGAILLGFVAYTVFSALSAADIFYNDPATAQQLQLDASTPARAAAASGLAAIGAIYLWFLVSGRRLREYFLPLLPRPSAPPRDNAIAPWEDQVRGFDPDAAIHAYALALAQLFLLQSVTDLIIAGGQGGLAAAGISQAQFVISSGITAAMLIAVSLAGVGFHQDRAPAQVLARLGLRLPTAGEAVVGIGAAIALLSFQFCAGAVWMILVPEELFNQQTQLSQAIAGSVTTFSAALLVALFSSVGEELAFRGALQPVLGLGLTSVLFALTHIQYQLTPATLIILVVGLVLGLVRRYYGTAAAILAHFAYNFTLLSLAVIASQVLPKT